MICNPVLVNLKNLLIKLKDYSKEIEGALKDNDPYRMANYIHSLSQQINEFYTKCRVLDDNNEQLSRERLGLVEACKDVLASALDLIGVSAPTHRYSDEKKED